jgi:hypothetical protein
MKQNFMQCGYCQTVAGLFAELNLPTDRIDIPVGSMGKQTSMGLLRRIPSPIITPLENRLLGERKFAEGNLPMRMLSMAGNIVVHSIALNSPQLRLSRREEASAPFHEDLHRAQMMQEPCSGKDHGMNQGSAK